MFKWDFWKKKQREDDIEVMPWGNQRFDMYTDTTRSSLQTGEEDWDVTQQTPVFSTAARPDYRSRTYEDYLRARGHARPYDGPAGYGNRRLYEEEEREGGLPTRRLIQIACAIALTAGLYYAFQSETPLGQRIQAFATDTMTQDSDLTALSGWWKSNVSDKMDAAVPAMSTGVGSQQTSGFVLPVQGTVSIPYDGTTHQGLTFDAALGADVQAVAQGTVVAVVKDDKEDYTVTINHGSLGKTVYKHLVAVDVAENDWVEGGKKIGILAKKGEAAHLFFAYEKDGQYIDPTSALPLAE
ncbi:MAG TPA: peptidoglycan DD-metalloendopeptidase family protein [Bacilli bacterium]|nr:peptidoglycan DD-metalloendopeptidase family protein [Bacilli bacterium]